MKISFYHLLFLILIFGCSTLTKKNKVEIKELVNEEIPTTFLKYPINIRLDFEAIDNNNSSQLIEVNAVLYNDNQDTVYFLSSSCDGEQYSVQFEESKFNLFPMLNCNVSYPMIYKIPPKGKYTFDFHLQNTSKEEKIKIGFDFYLVNKNFDLSTTNLGEIHYRTTDKQMIVWSEEKLIK